MTPFSILEIGEEAPQTIELQNYFFKYTIEDEPDQLKTTGIDIASGHLRILDQCLKCLSQRRGDIDASSDDSTIQPVNTSWPGLTEYAAGYFAWHIAQLANSQLNDKHFVEFMMQLKDLQRRVHLFVQNLVEQKGRLEPYDEVWRTLRGRKSRSSSAGADESEEEDTDPGAKEIAIGGGDSTTDGNINAHPSDRKKSSRFKTFLSKPMKSLRRSRSEPSKSGATGLYCFASSPSSESLLSPQPLPEKCEKTVSSDLKLEIPDVDSPTPSPVSASSTWALIVDTWIRRLDALDSEDLLDLGGLLLHREDVLELKGLWHALTERHLHQFLTSGSNEAAIKRYQWLENSFYLVSLISDL